MKRTLSALIASAMLAAGAGAVSPDIESLTYQLNGEVASVCDLVPDGTIAVNVDMTNFGNQAAAVIGYSCNSPYTLTVQSLNGGMEHQESGGAIVIDYAVETFGFSTGSQSFLASAIQGSPAEVDSSNDWTNILLNGGLQFGNIDLVFPGLADSNVAGTYEDELTVTLTADL